MYGIINQAVKDLVIQNAGEEQWQNICKEIGAPTDFMAMEYYPDKVTYDLVGIVSTKLNIPATGVLEAFGKYWVLYTAKEGYGSILDLFGTDFISCLSNLNNLHDRMGLTMPHLKPPKFTCTPISDKVIHLAYESSRVGLSPMVKGLIEGLAERFKVKASTEVLSKPDDHITIFQVTVLE